MTKFLFIGGPLDGQKIGVPESESTIKSTDGCYHRHQMNAGEWRFTIFVSDTLTIETATLRLLENYRPAVQS